ncbi:GmrSD restriction endonuclease domain-containing protein [Candidatus Venteria ishoeyi]|uniref:GmrSD restriction endonucleases C-terminal domain-containing protein n=1 Tax=Candidatus Venteria ishoeyi TaxID=1899563 RepID=A0A1H6F3U2_9GAMM|nr:DUF1524 domain-containing protein [Candidatus Venteria ishoeyi]SEH04848.1 Uncharacterised protein [Candidatus Venteria ishoeyi]
MPTISPINNNWWDTSICAEPETVNRIGNLTLLPHAENASFGKKSWVYKRHLYKALAAPSINEFEDILEDAAAQGIELSKSTLELMRNAEYIPFTLTIAKQKQDWDEAIIAQRGANLCDIIWDRLYAWL